MNNTTPSPSAAMQSTNNDCAASQHHTINQTTAQTHMLPCGRAGCPTVFVYGVGTNWPTVSCLISDHSLVCKGGLYGLNHAPPRSDTREAQQALSPAQLAPESIAGGRKRRKKEDERKQELEDDEYTEDVQPTSVTCCGCHKVITIDQRSRYYPGLWLKHRGKCPGILQDRELTRRRDRFLLSKAEWHSPATYSFDAGGEESDEDEYEVMRFSISDVRSFHDC
ncbi:uncharacterized protein EDB93DRAFT_1134451 [Suillus bovinus]|uniref:uncharacterized protein n=1 Tax=Suillus bovinus TaxID=48563 RepID=UPI001B861677|nr:uncharacterized protein EDB93DRAFT_1134451 [Suillus bovinus]KAG2153735.1 hypothetical protein EDB93DRAFT_1134451 [Suillus bovinus]